MSGKHLSVALCLVVATMAAGCGTMGGGSQLQNAVYDTHRRVSNLDKNLGGSIEKLNENTVELGARMDANDQQLKALQGVVEENTHRLEGLEKKLDGLRESLYRYFRLSTSAAPPPAGVPNETVMSDTVQVTPPPGRAPANAEPAPEGPVSSLPAPVAAPPAQPEIAPATPAAQPPQTRTAAPEPAAMSADAEYQRARRSYASGDYAAALEQFSAYLERNPNADNAPNAQFYKAIALSDMGKDEQAISEFEKLRTEHPDSVRVPSAMFSEGLCHKKLGQTERAKSLFQEVTQNFPMTPAADQARSELKKLQGN